MKHLLVIQGMLVVFIPFLNIFVDVTSNDTDDRVIARSWLNFFWIFVGLILLARVAFFQIPE